MLRPASLGLAPAVLLVLAAGLAVAAPLSAKDGRLERLTPEHRQFLEDVELLISDEERDAFLDLAKDYQREAFIARFWEARNPRPGSPANRFKEQFYSRRAEALARFKDFRDDRARFYTLHGEPSDVTATDCGLLLWPIEIWRYGYSEALGRGFLAIFVQPSGGGPFRLWRPAEGYQVLVALRFQQDFELNLRERCTELHDDVEELLATFRTYEIQGSLGPVDAERPPAGGDPEWLATFHAHSTDLPEAAAPLDATVELTFPGRHQSRTVVAARLRVVAEQAALASLADSESYGFELTGEVLRGDELFESFKYRFDLPAFAVDADGRLPLAFERYLRPGEYRWVLRLSDLNGSGVHRAELDVAVPRAVPDAAGETVAPAGEGAAAASGPEPVALALVAHGHDLVSGLARFAAAVTGDGVRKVRFLLDGRSILTKTRPPYSVELDLGSLPRTRRIRAVAEGEAGEELATDELLLNPGEHAFVVRLIEPRSGQRHSGTLRARADVQVPAGERLDRVEFYLDENRVATVYQEPWISDLRVAGDRLSFVRVVAWLADGNSNEDLVVINGADFLEAIDVRYVEVYASVLDGSGRPVHDLAAADFELLEDGAPQEVLRFERLDNLPIYASLLVDTSASMSDSLDEVRRAALEFFSGTVESKDRAAVITFSDQPRLAAGFTNDLKALAGALAGLRAERSTALYDSVLFGLYYFSGLRGQKALLVLSDGEDRRSRATFDQALDFARGAGVTIYAIGLKGGKGGRAARAQLTRLATETGGRSYFIESASELGEIYAAIQRDLRSRYLLAYQAPAGESKEFRAVEVRVRRAGHEVVAMRGYLP